MSDSERGQVAATAAEVYEEFFLPALFDQWPDRLLAAADVTTGSHLLDVGTGTGVVARTAAPLVGANGRVVGLDSNPGMLTVARRTDGIEWVLGVAEDIPFEDHTFDIVTSQFALMFFEDRPKALAEMRRVLQKGGKLAVATWASLEETPGYLAVVDLLGTMFGRDTADALRAPYTLGDPEELRTLLQMSFHDVAIERREGTARFDSIEAWVHTDIKGWTLSEMSDSDYRRFLDTAETELARFADAAGVVTFSAPALIATGMAD